MTRQASMGCELRSFRIEGYAIRQPVGKDIRVGTWGSKRQEPSKPKLLYDYAHAVIAAFRITPGPAKTKYSHYESRICTRMRKTIGEAACSKVRYIGIDRLGSDPTAVVAENPVISGQA